jgi:hypothetical protein
VHVWPEDGFDNFTWTGSRRSWFGMPRPVDNVEREEDAVLDRYAAGAVPPFLTLD